MTDEIGKRMPRIGKARDLDVEFLSMFADVIASITVLSAMLKGHPMITDEGKKVLIEREEILKKRFEGIITFLNEKE